MNKETLKQKALIKAIENFICEGNAIEVYEKLQGANENDWATEHAVIWQPFEDYRVEDVVQYIHDLRDNYIEFYEQIIEQDKNEQCNYTVELPTGHHARPDQVKDGVLAFKIKRKKLIVLYTRGEAIKKARIFGGKSKLFKGKFDKEKHIII